jgi:hypothetical protein
MKTGEKMVEKCVLSPYSFILVNIIFCFDGTEV